MTAADDAERYVRDGLPAFVPVYDRIRELVESTGLLPGDPLPGDVTLAELLEVDRELVREALLLLGEDGKLVRRDRRWCVAAPLAGPLSFTDSFDRLLGGRVRPVRRLLAAIEPGSRWSHELLRTSGLVLTWETVFAADDVLLAATLEMMVVDAVPPELKANLVADEHDLDAWPTMLEALGTERRAGLTPEIWRLAQISRATERLSWMELPLHGIPAALTVVLAEGGRPVYLAKNLFDLGSFDLVVDRLAPRQGAGP
jgi:DNA-binding GntR family transcriptional regulator